MNKTIKSKNGSIVIGMFVLFIVMTFIATMTVRMKKTRN